MPYKPARPFVFINAAMSADGKIATAERKQTRISGTLDLDRVDELRAASDAVMVGIGTVLSDNPSLTVKSEQRRDKRRAQGLPENSVRIVVDSAARTPLATEGMWVPTSRWETSAVLEAWTHSMVSSTVTM